MVPFAITVYALVLSLDAKQEAKETNPLSGTLPIDMVAELHESTGSHVKTEEETAVEPSGMRDEDRPDVDRPEKPVMTKSLIESAKEMVEVKKMTADPAADSREVPYYFLNFPIAVKFIDEKGKAKIAIMDRITLPGDLPIEFMYVYPLVFFLLYSFIWCLCCRRSNRTGLSFRLVIESAACFMCLWADLATKHKVIGSGRAWSYVILMVVLLSAWNIAELCVKDDAVMNSAVFWTFQSIVAVVWIAYSIERMYVRKFYRRAADPMAAAHPAIDCAAVACCGQFTALQEAQLMSNLQQDMQTSQTSQASQKTPW